jgi:hypothetical protein
MTDDVTQTQAAPITVRGPDGNTFGFPAGTPEDTILSVLNNHYNELAQRTAAATPEAQQEAAELGSLGVDPYVGTLNEKPYNKNIPSVAAIPLNDIPTTGGKMAVKAGLPFTRDKDAVKDILDANIPGTKYGTDEWGNPVAIVNGKPYHMESFGTNALGFERGVVQGGMGIGAAVGAAMLAPEAVVGLPLYAAIQGGAAVGSNLAGQGAAQLAGSKQSVLKDPTSMILEAGLGAGAPVVGKFVSTLAKLGEPEAFAELGRGAKTWLRDLVDKFQNGKIPVSPENSADLLLDTPEGHGAALNIVGQKGRPTQGANDIISAVDQRASEAPQRIASDVDAVVGQHIVESPEFAEALKASRLANSDELTEVLKNAPNVPVEDVKKVVNEIDGLSVNAKGKVASALQRIRSMLVNPPTERQLALGIPEGFENYETSPQALQNTISEINNLIRNGGNIGADSIRPGELPGLNAQVGRTRNSISQILQKNVKDANGNPVYANIMGKYPNIYDMGDALEMGRNILNRGTYINDFSPTVLKNFLANPDTAYAVKVGARQAIQDKIGLAPSDVAALRSVPSSENSYINNSLSQIFGEDTPDKLIKIADRENGYNIRKNELKSAFDNARKATGAETVEATRQPIAPQSTAAVLNLPYEKLGAAPLNYAYRKLTGQAGPEFIANQGRILTTPGDQVEMLRQGLEARQAAERNINKALAGVSVGTPAILGANQQADGGRIERKSGGAVIDDAADALVREALRNQKLLANHTEQMLALPDDAVVQALHVAKSVAA